MKVNKIFKLFTVALLLSEILVFTGCKSKTMKVDPVSVGSDYSSGTGQTATFSIENGHILDDGDENSTYLNPSSFYNSDGTLVEYKEIYSQYWNKIELANETKSYPQYNPKYNIFSKTELTAENLYNH